MQYIDIRKSDPDTREYAHTRVDSASEETQNGLQSGLSDEFETHEAASGASGASGILARSDDDVRRLVDRFNKKYRDRKEPLFWTLPASGIANGPVKTLGAIKVLPTGTASIVRKRPGYEVCT